MQGRQRDPSVDTFRSPLSGSITMQEMKIFNFLVWVSNQQPVAFTVPLLCHDWSILTNPLGLSSFNTYSNNSILKAINANN